MDVGDVTLSGDKVTLNLPVSEVEWKALKGCSRSRSCVCDTALLRPLHELRAHMELNLK